jgi:phospholipid/cholesterol/gamma-HCH transport system ATP-binding protein
MIATEPSPSGDRHLALAHVDMAFGGRTVLENLSCSFPAGQISVILGGSGSGKSTILRLIAGLVRPIGGQIMVDGEDICRLSERQLRGPREKIGMLFQGGALLDSLTVFDNLALPLREHGDIGAAQIASEVHDRLQAVGLSDVDAMLPNQLSGGMRKRVALARAIILKPLILLCDEPFSGLDPITTRRVEALLIDINRRRNITIVVVSHHIASTMRMASQAMILLPDGNVLGTPEELREHHDPRIEAFLAADRDEIGELAEEVEARPEAPRP